MTVIARSVFFIALAAIAAAGLVGCGGEIHPAIHDPLLVMPPDVRIVLQADIISSRSLENFNEIERFIRNRDDERDLRNLLPFDYQEFTEHWQLDLFQNIDKLAIGVYETGVLWVMVGQFDSGHIVSAAQEEQSIVGSEPRGSEHGDYTLYRHGAGPNALLPDIEVARESLRAMGQIGQSIGPLAQRVYSGQELYEAWPTENIWVRSNSRNLIGAALDLWDNQGSENLHSDKAFEDLFTARPHSALVWIGLPPSSLVPPPWQTLEAELDIRDIISPRIILGYPTESDAEADFANIDRQVEQISTILQSAPQSLTDPLTGNAGGGRIDELDMAQLIASAAQSLETNVYGTAKVVEVSVDIPLDDFKRLFAMICNSTGP